MNLVADYAWARPGGRALARSYVGIMRYLTDDNSGKRIDADELNDLHANGLPVGLVWENGALDATEGATLGAAHGARARTQAAALGWPESRPIYFAVDTGASWAAVSEYAAAFAANVGHPTGPYGDYAVIEGAAVDGYVWLWQTVAWSGGARSQRALLWQRNWVESGIAGIDENEVQSPDWGGWDGSAIAPPRPKENDAMIYVEPVKHEAILWDGGVITAEFTGAPDGFGIPADANQFKDDHGVEIVVTSGLLIAKLRVADKVATTFSSGDPNAPATPIDVKPVLDALDGVRAAVTALAG